MNDLLNDSTRTPMWRSRWAAIGAAVAVMIGGGGLFMAQASPGASVFVPVTPTRVLDTRVNLGLAGPFQTGVARILDVAGLIPIAPSGTATLVPDGATAVVLNVTVVSPTAGGFVAIRPGDASGNPSTSSLNFPTGTIIPNGVTVQLPIAGPNAGKLNLFYFSNTPGATTHLLADIVGYYQAGNSGEIGPPGLPGDVGSRNRITDDQIAMQRWDLDPGSNGVFAVGANPIAVAFDGTYAWVSNFDDDSVSKIDPATNSVIETVTVGDGPQGMAFDGSSIWVANWSEGTVSKIDVATSVVTGSPGAPIIVHGNPTEIVFDGTNIWVSNFGNDTVSKLDPLTNDEIAMIPMPDGPTGLAFDGEFVWVSCNGTPLIIPIDVSDDSVGVPIAVGNAPFGIVFDGTYLWVAITSGNYIVKVDPVTASVFTPTIVAANPKSLTYDGTSIWVTSAPDGKIVKVNAITGEYTGDQISMLSPDGIGFDGTNIWVLSSANFLLKFLPF